MAGKGNSIISGNENIILNKNAKKMANGNNEQKRKALAPIGGDQISVNNKLLVNVGKRQAIKPLNKNVKVLVEPKNQKSINNNVVVNKGLTNVNKAITRSTTNLLALKQSNIEQAKIDKKQFTIYCDENDLEFKKPSIDQSKKVIVDLNEQKSSDQIKNIIDKENKENIDKVKPNEIEVKASEKSNDDTDNKSEIMAIDELTINEKSFKDEVVEEKVEIVKEKVEIVEEKDEKVANESITMTIDQTMNDDENEHLDETMHEITVVNVSFDQMLIEHCIEYLDDIHLYLFARENEFRSDPLYMPKQQEITGKMRCILVDWMIEVSDEYKLSDETLFLAVNFIDRFLSCMSIARASFQLLGTTSLFISSKYEEIYPPDVNEFVYITADSYTMQQVLSMEKLVLKVLHFDLSAPTSSYFLRKYNTYLNFGKDFESMAKYFCYLTLMDEMFTKFTASEIAVASIIMASHAYNLKNVKLDFYLNTLILYYLKDENKEQLYKMKINIIQECVVLLYEMRKFSDDNQGITKKFATSDYSFVSTIPLKDSIPLVRSYF